MTIDTTDTGTGTTETGIAVCRVDDLVPERGVAALVGAEQVALFRIGEAEVLGVQQLDPFGPAHVMSRGIVGSRRDAEGNERITVASPLYKQVFDLRTGECLDALGKEPLHLRTWSVRVEDGLVVVEPLPQIRRQ